MLVTALSLGAGIQSTALALLLDEGRLPGLAKPDLAVFADTFADPPNVYATLDILETKLSYPIVRGSFSNLDQDVWKDAQGLPTRRHRTDAGRGMPDIPVYSVDGGITQRQCTGKYKVDVIKRLVRQFAGVNPPALQVVQYMGISRDEVHRVKPAREQYITHRYPLVEHRWTRWACADYLSKNHPDVPAGRSSCYFCPFRSLPEWQALRKEYPQLYQRAEELDTTLRTGPRRLSLVKHRAGLKGMLQLVDRQIPLSGKEGWGMECEGHCDV